MSSSFVPFGKTADRPLVPDGASISEHRVTNLNAEHARSYTQIKATFDPNTRDKAQNNRFTLSELVSGQLSVEEEDRKRFEKKVSESVAAEMHSIRETVLATAQAEGFEAGRKAAYDEEKIKLAKAIEGLVSLTSTLEKAKLDLSSQYETQLLEVAFRLSKLVVNYEINERPIGITATVTDILGRISKEDDVVLKIGLHEYEAIDHIREDLAKLARNGRIHIELNDALKAGDCIVESMSGEIASFVDLKFEKLHETLFSKQKHKTGSGI